MDCARPDIKSDLPQRGSLVALVELIVAILAGNCFQPRISEWVNLLASFGAIVLTFLAGAELESQTLKKFRKESLVLGLLSFLAPFILSWLAAQFLLGWERPAAQIAGLALSTTSVAVVYAVMLESGLNEKPIGKLILAACFVTEDRKSTRLNSSHIQKSRMPSSA